MKPVKLQLRLQPAPANLLRTAIRGKVRSVYVPVLGSNGPALGAGECVWTAGVVSLFVKAHQGEDGGHAREARQGRGAPLSRFSEPERELRVFAHPLGGPRRRESHDRFDLLDPVEF